MTEKYDIIIIGAGIVGLSTAYQLLFKNPKKKILILEKEKEVALHQTGRNSGVVHSGIYYKPGSLKARNCIKGRQELLDFCNHYHVPYKKKHKLIVATKDDEVKTLLELFKRGKISKIPDIKLLARDEIYTIEPNVQGKKAIFLPHCYIVDYKKVAEKLKELLETVEVKFCFNEKVITISDQGVIITNRASYFAKQYINCAGLFADRIARSCREKLQHQIVPFRGEYYDLVDSDRVKVNGLIYPVPNPRFPFLGVHITPTMGGKLEVGPNAVLAYSREGYNHLSVKFSDLKEILTYSGFWHLLKKHWKIGCYEFARSLSKNLFVKDLRKLLPNVKKSDLIVSNSGVRAQAVDVKGKLADDFIFSKDMKGLHVLNAPSPAATASFAIGKTLAEMIL